MIRMVVVSDSHGDEQAIRRVLAKEPCDVVVHLGDGAAEAKRVAASMPNKRFIVVRGNCDYGEDAPVTRTESVGGVLFYLTHGYTEHVKSGLLRLTLATAEKGAAVALYGHTHVPATDLYQGLLLFNPGSVRCGLYGVLAIDNGIVHEEHRTL